MTSLFEDHLNLDAVVAFADGEMSLTAFQRAAAHIARCSDCATEVAEQTSARQQLRSAACPSIPSSLLDALRSIPVAVPAAPPPVGLSRDSVTGRASRTVQGIPGPPEFHPQPGQHLAQQTGQQPGSRARTTRSRGFRLGAGAIVAGLAVGAIAAATVAERSSDPSGPATGPDTAQVGFQFAPPTATAVMASVRSGR